MGVVTVRTKSTEETPARRALLKAFGDRPGRHGHPAGTAQRRGDPSAPRVGRYRATRRACRDRRRRPRTPRLARASTAPHVTILDPRPSLRSAAQIVVQMGRLNQLQAEILGAAVHHHAALAPTASSDALVHACDNYGIELHRMPRPSRSLAVRSPSPRLVLLARTVASIDSTAQPLAAAFRPRAERTLKGDHHLRPARKYPISGRTRCSMQRDSLPRSTTWSGRCPCRLGVEDRPCRGRGGQRDRS